MTRKRKWMLRGAAVLVAVVAGAGTWAALNATELRTRYAAARLAAATTDEERARWADALVGHGEPGVRKLAQGLSTDDEPARAAAGAALEKYLTALPEGDPRAVTASGVILDAFPSATDAGKRAVLRLVPAVLQRTGSVHASRCRTVVAEGLRMGDTGARLAAVRLALHADLKLRGELVPLLASPEPELRGRRCSRSPRPPKASWSSPMKSCSAGCTTWTPACGRSVTTCWWAANARTPRSHWAAG